MGLKLCTGTRRQIETHGKPCEEVEDRNPENPLLLVLR